jgi:predicted metal-dependent phosphotriesterase family hydrolase
VGYADHVIIGSDTGWYGCAGGRCWHAQDYSSIPAEFVPAMRAAGLSAKLIDQLMHDNPWHAYSRRGQG